MTVRLWDNAYYSGSAASFDVIMGYGSSQGVLHAWTPDEWAQAKATGKPCWLIVFWGHSASDAIAQAQAVGAVGVVLDVEGQYTSQAVASGQPQAFGDACKAAGFPCCIYSGYSGVQQLIPHFDAGWVWTTATPPNPLPSRMAYQWNHQSGYDESLADDWYAHPASGQGGTPTVALDQNLINRGFVAWFLQEHGVDPTGPNIDWFMAHASDVGAGQMEWEIEGALGGTDPAEPAAIGASAKRLRQLGQGQVPDDIMAAIKAAVGSNGGGGAAPQHTHSISVSGMTSGPQ